MKDKEYHTIWCEAMVSKAKNSRRNYYSLGVRRIKTAPSQKGLKRYNYTTSELKKLLTTI